MTRAGTLIIAAGGLTIVAQLARGKRPAPPVFIGTALAGLALVGVESGHPEIARQFAMVVFLTSLLTNGYAVGQAITRIATPDDAAAAKTIPGVGALLPD